MFVVSLSKRHEYYVLFKSLNLPMYVASVCLNSTDTRYLVNMAEAGVFPLAIRVTVKVV